MKKGMILQEDIRTTCTDISISYVQLQNPHHFIVYMKQLENSEYCQNKYSLNIHKILSFVNQKTYTHSSVASVADKNGTKNY